MADLEFSERILRDVIRSELAAHKHVCRIPITDEQALQAGMLISEITSSGGGDLMQGFRDIQENHAWLKRQRQRGEKLSTAFCYTFIAGIVSGVLVALWRGVKLLIRES